MRTSEIEKKARELGIRDTWKYSKKELIRQIQNKEGNFACFGTAVSKCSQTACCWMSDCVK